MSGRTSSIWRQVLLRRAFQIAALLLVIGSVCFLMARALPGDMAMRIAASRYGYDFVGSAAANAVAQELSLQRPPLQAWLSWFGDIARLDLGNSLVSGEPVWNEMGHHLGASIDLAITTLALAMLIGLPLGIAAGLRPGGLADRFALAFAVFLRATPAFLLGIMLMLLLAVHWGVLPAAHDDQGATIWLPALTLALGLAAGLARVTRSAVSEALRSPACEFSRSKGLSDFQTLIHHALRLAALPILAYLGVHLVLLVEGTVVVESLFAWPGVGHALVHAVFARDVPVIQGTALCMGFIFIIFNLLLDALMLAIDPRQRKPGASHG